MFMLPLARGQLDVVLGRLYRQRVPALLVTRHVKGLRVKQREAVTTGDD